MDFFARLDSLRERWNVLDHSFYTRWSAGELSRADLATYAGEYRHVVVALADEARDSVCAQSRSSSFQSAAIAAAKRAAIGAAPAWTLPSTTRRPAT